MSCLLVERYPQLGRVPHLDLAALPTPVEALPGLGHKAWIKRDDLTHAEYGGNKIRKLEFILAEARAQGCNHIITFGAIGTNHGVATAMLCHKLGLRCTVLLFDQPLTETVKKNLRTMAAYGAELDYRGSLFRTVLGYYLHPARLKRQSYFLFAGGSNTAGTFGFVNAALELQQQIERGECPRPGKIYLPVGSSASLAGLTLGVQLAGLDCEVVGIRVAPSHVGPFAACTTETVNKLMQQTARHLRRLDVEVPALPSPLLLDQYYGEGYGVMTEGGREAMAVFAAQGIALEQTYTAKAAAAYLQAVEHGSEPVMFWNTFNSRPPLAELGSVELPETLQQLLVA